MIQTFKTHLAIKKQLTDSVWLFKFVLDDPNSVSFVAGQYLILKIGETGSRNYSIASPNFQNDRVDFIVQIIPNGLASTYLMSLTEKDEVKFQGPAGVFILKTDTGRDKIFLATGTGIAPIRSMIESYARDVKKSEAHFYILWGLRTKKDLYLAEYFAELKKQFPYITYKICFSKEEDLLGLEGDTFGKGRVNGHLLELLGISEENSVRSNGIASHFDYYICGGRDVAESLRQFVSSLGVEKTQIFFEKF